MEHAKLAAFSVSKHLEAFVATLADVGPTSAKTEQAFDLGGSVGGPEIDVAPIWAVPKLMASATHRCWRG